jgi:hypothetical protein
MVNVRCRIYKSILAKTVGKIILIKDWQAYFNETVSKRAFNLLICTIALFEIDTTQTKKAI